MSRILKNITKQDKSIYITINAKVLFNKYMSYSRSQRYDAAQKPGFVGEGDDSHNWLL